MIDVGLPLSFHRLIVCTWYVPRRIPSVSRISVRPPHVCLSLRRITASSSTPAQVKYMIDPGKDGTRNTRCHEHHTRGVICLRQIPQSCRALVVMSTRFGWILYSTHVSQPLLTILLLHSTNSRRFSPNTLRRITTKSPGNNVS